MGFGHTLFLANDADAKVAALPAWEPKAAIDETAGGGAAPTTKNKGAAAKKKAPAAKGGVAKPKAKAKK